VKTCKKAELPLQLRHPSHLRRLTFCPNSKNSSGLHTNWKHWNVPCSCL
jgi:hypothetical protein